MSYRIELRPAAARSLRKLDRQNQKRIEGALILLAQNPYPPSATALKRRPGFRVRIGNYRIIYTIDHDQLVVVVIDLGHSRDIYQQ